MADTDGESVLFVHQRDLSSPVGCTLAYYLSDELSASHTVHVICRKRAKERDGESAQGAVLYDLNTGDVPIVSAVAFHLLAALLAVVLALRHRYTAVVSFKSCLIQGWLGSIAGGSRFDVGLQSVPVRQSEDFRDAAGGSAGLRQRIAAALLATYAWAVGVLLARSSTVVCLTEGIADVTESIYGVDLSDAHVLGMGVDVETFAGARESAPSAVRSDRTEDSSVPSAGRTDPSDDPADPPDDRSGPSSNGADEWTLTYVGNVSETRGLERVLEALAATDRDVTFRIAGQGPDPYVEAFRERAEALGVADRVEWLGLIPHEEVPELLASSDFAVSPLPDIESYRVSFPAKLLEYLAAGTTVVATDIDPHERLIEDGANGYLYDGSPGALVETLERAIESGDRAAIERRATETAEAYDWSRVAERYEAAIFGTHSPEPRDVPARPPETATN